MCSPPAPGTTDFAYTLQLLAEQGADAFYEDSPISAAIIDAVRNDHMPGGLDLDDLRRYDAAGTANVVTSPVRTGR
jgi:gamma-glutamyltranspeptidase